MFVKKKKTNMSKKDYYIIEKNISKLYHNEPTNFLDQTTYKNIINKIKNIKYNTSYPYKVSEKVIIYTNSIPNIKVLEFISYDKLSHREILGSLYGLNIDTSLFGDIIITNNHYYIMVIESIYNLITNNLSTIGNHHIKLKEVSLDILNDYERQYEEITLIVSSLRIDNIISNLIGTSRESIKKKFLNDEIILNYIPCHKLNYILKEKDIFSIKRNGKYIFNGIINKTKKDNYLIKLQKYIDN